MSERLKELRQNLEKLREDLVSDSHYTPVIGQIDFLLKQMNRTERSLLAAEQGRVAEGKVRTEWQSKKEVIFPTTKSLTFAVFLLKHYDAGKIFSGQDLSQTKGIKELLLKLGDIDKWELERDTISPSHIEHALQPRLYSLFNKRILQKRRVYSANPSYSPGRVPYNEYQFTQSGFEMIAKYAKSRRKF